MSNRERSESVVVIGAGIVGIGCASYLHEAGFNVTVIDQGRSPMLVRNQTADTSVPVMFYR